MDSEAKQFIVTMIGSRSTPPAILESMTRLAKVFYRNGWLLRSGGASGADSAAEAGFPDNKEIYLPFKGFNGNKSPLYGVCNGALEIASKIHPAWHNCNEAARLLHGRNVYQILGRNLDKPSDLLICFTENGEIKGGTATAIKLAMQHGIPVINLGKKI